MIVTNLIGAIWAQLVPTVVALALYWCFADAVLILQCLYYKHFRIATASPTPIETSEDPQQPLLAQRGNDEVRRRLFSASQKRRSLPDVISPGFDTLEKGTSTKALIINAASILGVVVVGTLGWLIAWKIGLWRPISGENDDGKVRESVGAVILGYISAVCYLGQVGSQTHQDLAEISQSARIPQTVKNYREKSCEGRFLSLRKKM